MKTRKILNSGFVTLVDALGHDALVQEAYFVRHEDHLRQTIMQFEVKCPFFLMKEWQKFNDSEVSWVKELEEFYVPSYFSGSFSEREQNDLNTKVQNFNNWSFNFYKKLLAKGVSKDQARMVLPQNIFVTFTWTVNARTLRKFFESNMRAFKSHNLSPEMEQYVKVIFELFKEKFPLLGEMFESAL